MLQEVTTARAEAHKLQTELMQRDAELERKNVEVASLQRDKAQLDKLLQVGGRVLGSGALFLRVCRCRSVCEHWGGALSGCQQADHASPCRRRARRSGRARSASYRRGCRAVWTRMWRLRRPTRRRAVWDLLRRGGEDGISACPAKQQHGGAGL